MKPGARAYAMLAIVMLLWAGNSIVGRAVRDLIPPFTLAFGRWTGALLLMTPFALPHVRADWPVLRRHWRSVLFFGLTGVGAFNALLYSGLHHTTATNALLLQALIPALVLIIGAGYFRDRALPGQIVGVIVSTLGVGIIIFHGDPSAILQLRFGGGDIAILCACVAWALYTATLRLRPAVQPITFLFATFAVGALVMVPLAASEAKAIVGIPWQPPVFAAFAYVAILPSLIAYFLFNAAVAQIGSAAAGQTISLMPLFGALLAALLLGETLHRYHWVAMALILTGVLIASMARPRTA